MYTGTLNFFVFVQNTITSTINTMSFISSGVSSGTNAADVQDNIDRFRCEDLEDLSDAQILPEARAAYEDFCDNLEILRDSMVASAVSSHIYLSGDLATYIGLF